MRKLWISMLVAIVAAGLVPASCGDGGGPRIVTGLNTRMLCNQNVSGVAEEERCENATVCTQTDYCWDPVGLDHLDSGFCRQCADDTNCDVGLVCDYGWCRSACTQDSDCDAGSYCTSDICRPAIVTDFSFCNEGSKDLEIYPSQTSLHGGADACAFGYVEWDRTEDPIVLPTNDCALMRLYYRPTDLGEYRAWINVFSSDDTFSPLPLFLCGDAVEAQCRESIDGECPECPTCSEPDFTTEDWSMEDDDPGCPLVIM